MLHKLIFVSTVVGKEVAFRTFEGFLSCQDFQCFWSLLEDRMLHKGVWVTTLLDTILRSNFQDEISRRRVEEAKILYLYLQISFSEIFFRAYNFIRNNEKFHIVYFIYFVKAQYSVHQELDTEIRRY